MIDRELPGSRCVSEASIALFGLLWDVAGWQGGALTEEEILHVRAISSWASFCQGIRRYSFRIIFWRSSQSFQAWTETFSKIRWPSSPGHGGVSSPGISFRTSRNEPCGHSYCRRAGSAGERRNHPYPHVNPRLIGGPHTALDAERYGFQPLL